MTLKAGDSVKYAEPALRSLRDMWLQEGASGKKEQKWKWLDNKKAERGVLTEICKNDYCTQFYRITWDNGSTSDTATYLVEPA